MFESPTLQLMMDELQEILEAEKIVRQKFYEDIESSDELLEFINGEIVKIGILKLKNSLPLENLHRILETFVSENNLGAIGENSMISLSRNDYLPELSFFGKEKARQFLPLQTRFPAPDFVVEIATPESQHIDFFVKHVDYAAHGVAEYWIIEPSSKQISQFLLKKDQREYELHHKTNNGILHCHVLDGLNIPVEAIFDGGRNLSFVHELINGK